MKVMMGTLMAGLMVTLSGCPGELYYNGRYIVIFNPQKDLSAECPVLRVKMEYPGTPDYIGDFDASKDTSHAHNGYDQYVFPIHVLSDPFIPTTTVQCVKDGQVVGESVRNNRPEKSLGWSDVIHVHISAPKANQVYVGTYASKTGIAPVIEIETEISVDWIAPMPLIRAN
ncbi:MAG: hypothetical protein U0Z75_07815 [Deinococcaceae bacterium]